MKNSNLNQPMNNDETPLVAQDGIEALISALSYATASNEAAHQPTIQALTQLATAQLAQQKAAQTSSEQITEQKQKIEQQSQEISKLKQQIEHQNKLLAPLMDWRTVTAYIILSAIITAGYMTTLYKILPPQVDSATLEKINFLYNQEQKRVSKPKK